MIFNRCKGFGVVASRSNAFNALAVTIKKVTVGLNSTLLNMRCFHKLVLLCHDLLTEP